jgi:hypothetical protein
MSVDAFLCAEFTAAAVLAMWVVMRFPKLGPKSIRSALLIVGAALALMRFLPAVISVTVRLPHGAYVALFGCALPCLVGVFLAAGWTMRLLAGAFGGSGGGGGHRVPARARR